MLETLRYLKHETDVWFEVTTLLIPGHNDSELEVARLCDWFLEELGPDVPLHFSAFHPDFRMKDVPSTPPQTCRRARDQAKQAGIHHVYSGNIHDEESQSTYCSGCGQKVIRRDWYDISDYRLSDGACQACAAVVPGTLLGWRAFPPGLGSQTAAPGDCLSSSRWKAC